MDKKKEEMMSQAGGVTPHWMVKISEDEKKRHEEKMPFFGNGQSAAELFFSVPLLFFLSFIFF